MMDKLFFITFLIMSLTLLSACSTTPESDNLEPLVPLSIPESSPAPRIMTPPSQGQRSPQPLAQTPDSSHYSVRGTATWYTRNEHGRRTANGEVYDLYGMTAAHATLPFASQVRVINTQSGESVVVKINDRLNDTNAVIRLSYQAAKKLNLLGQTSPFVEVQGLSSYSSMSSTNRFATHLATNTASVGRGGTYLQAGAFSNATNAQRLQMQLRPLFSQSVAVQWQGGWYRVRIGPFNEMQAPQAATLLQRQGIYDVLIVRE